MEIEREWERERKPGANISYGQVQHSATFHVWFSSLMRVLMLPQLGFAVTPKAMFDCLLMGVSVSPWLSVHRSIVERRWSLRPFTSAPKNNTSEAIFAWRVTRHVKASVYLSKLSFFKHPNYPFGQWVVNCSSCFFCGGSQYIFFVGRLKKKRNPLMVLDVKTRKEIHLIEDKKTMWYWTVKQTTSRRVLV